MPASSRQKSSATSVTRRADAQRSIAAILDAGLIWLSHNSEVNMAAIARAAGVGRVTLYAHFASKHDLVDSVVAHAIASADQALDTVDIDNDPPRIALARLTTSSWQLLSSHRQLRIVGERHLGAARMRAHHDKSVARVRRLIKRGQEAGVFRADQPRDWLVATYYSLLHTAADEVSAGRLRSSAAGDIVAATVISALAPPASGSIEGRRP
jgi:AcrR family transcriptional regulator